MAARLNDINKDRQHYFGHALVPLDMSSVKYIAKSLEADIETADELGERPLATTPLAPVTGRNFAPLPIDLVSDPNRGNSASKLMFRSLKLQSSIKKRLKTYKHAPRTLAGQIRQTPKVFSIHQDSHTPKAVAPTTPHVIRALQQRHAATIAPARNRRRSGRAERESPRDALRQLSRSMLTSPRKVESY